MVAMNREHWQAHVEAGVLSVVNARLDEGCVTDHLYNKPSQYLVHYIARAEESTLPVTAAASLPALVRACRLHCCR